MIRKNLACAISLNDLTITFFLFIERLLVPPFTNHEMAIQYNFPTEIEFVS